MCVQQPVNVEGSGGIQVEILRIDLFLLLLERSHTAFTVSLRTLRRRLYTQPGVSKIPNAGSIKGARPSLWSSSIMS